MRKAFRKNLVPKTVSLLLAIAIWFLIKEHLREQSDSGFPGGQYPRAIPVDEEDAP
jgi:hypothetical protein